MSLFCIIYWFLEIFPFLKFRNYTDSPSETYDCSSVSPCDSIIYINNIGTDVINSYFRLQIKDSLVFNFENVEISGQLRPRRKRQLYFYTTLENISVFALLFSRLLMRFRDEKETQLNKLLQHAAPIPVCGTENKNRFVYDIRSPFL